MIAGLYAVRVDSSVRRNCLSSHRSYSFFSRPTSQIAIILVFWSFEDFHTSFRQVLRFPSQLLLDKASGPTISGVLSPQFLSSGLSDSVVCFSSFHRPPGASLFGRSGTPSTEIFLPGLSIPFRSTLLLQWVKNFYPGVTTVSPLVLQVASCTHTRLYSFTFSYRLLRPNDTLSRGRYYLRLDKRHFFSPFSPLATR